ncbi:MAG: hypothetical protein AAGM22_26075 [Acidobacteriota bacterium]
MIDRQLSARKWRCATDLWAAVPMALLSVFKFLDPTQVVKLLL